MDEDALPPLPKRTPIDTGITRLAMAASLDDSIGEVLCAGSDLATNGHQVMKDTPDGRLVLVPDADGDGLPMGTRMLAGSMVPGAMVGGPISLIVLLAAERPLAAAACFIIICLVGAQLGRSLWSRLPPRGGRGVVLGTKGLQVTEYHPARKEDRLYTATVRYDADGAWKHERVSLRVKGGGAAGQLDNTIITGVSYRIFEDRWLVSAVMERARAVRAVMLIPRIRAAMDAGKVWRFPVGNDGMMALRKAQLEYDEIVPLIDVTGSVEMGTIRIQGGGKTISVPYHSVWDAFVLLEYLGIQTLDPKAMAWARSHFASST